MKRENTRIQITLTVVFVVLAALIFSLLDSRKNHNQQQRLHLITKRYHLSYNTIYDQYRKLAAIVYSGIVRSYNVQGVYQQLLTADEERKNSLRAELLAQVMPRYEEVREAGNVRQLHFHLRNNESFLRLHRPERFGDNLTGIRDTVNFVNSTHAPIDGFEEGRIFNGYRFVFPITGADQTHLGSMEISFGPEALTTSMMKQYKVLSNFFIKKDVVTRKLFPDEKAARYSESHHQGYLYDNEVLEALSKITRQEMKTLKPQKSTTDVIYRNAHSGQAMSFYDLSSTMVFTTIPVLNPVTHEMVAFLTVRSRSDFLMNATQRFHLNFSLSLVLLAMILSTFYLQYGKRKILESNTRQLEKQKQRLLETQKIANIGHWELDHRTKQLSWSEQANLIFGLKQGEFAGSYRDFLRKVHPDDRHFVKNAHLDSVKNHKPCDIQHRIITGNGTEKWVRGKCVTEYDDTGKPLSALGIIHDITLQHETMSLLQRERDMFMSGPVVTFAWKNSENWPVEHVSANVLDILGYSQAEFFDGSVAYVTLIHPNDLQRVIDEVTTNSTPENSSFIHEPYRLIKRNGELIWVLDSTTLIRNKQGEITHYQGYLIDITKMIRMEEEVVTTKNLLKTTQYEEQRKRFESLETMAGAIAHRFNNAMMAVQGYLELLIPSLPDDSEGHKMAVKAGQAARGATQIGSMMLSYVGQQPITLKECSLEGLVRECVTELKDLFPPSISLKFVPPSKPLYCSMDKHQIKEVIESILTNAVEALEDASGTVEITFGSDYFSASSFPIPFQNDKLNDAIYVFCQIKDSGHGIKGEELLRIFEPFYTTRFVGRGLGLALSVGVMRAHRGAITVDSVPGVGSSFRLLLPLITPPQQTTSSSNGDKGKSVNLSGNILFADDEEIVLDLGRRMLEMLGFNVHTVVDGQEAVDIIRRQDIEFCAVLMDISMPKMDGIEAMKAIREIDPVLPILLSSGYSEGDFLFEKNEGSQPDGFLGKPFQLSDMRSSLEKVLSKY